MMRQRKQFYPANWPLLSFACKDAAGWRCQRCRIRHGSTRISKRTGQVYRVWLHAAHVRLHDTMNPHPELMALCPTCHGRYDERLRRREARAELEALKHQQFLRRKVA